MPNRWWYDCLPWCDPSPRSQKDDPSGVRDPLQWSSAVFQDGKNTRKVDFLAMIGGVYLGESVDLCMRDDPSVLLPAEWQFAPGQVAWPFISSVCKAETHDIATKYFYRLFDNYTRHGDPVMGSTIHMLPRFRARFFEQSHALMAGFKTLMFSHGLDYATMASTYPDHVSLWHFVPSLDDLPDGWLTPLGLSPHQLAQMLMNYRSCLAQIFANGRDYHSIPPIHKSPVTWCSTFYSAPVHAT